MGGRGGGSGGGSFGGGGGGGSGGGGGTTPNSGDAGNLTWTQLVSLIPMVWTSDSADAIHAVTEWAKAHTDEWNTEFFEDLMEFEEELAKLEGISNTTVKYSAKNQDGIVKTVLLLLLENQGLPGRIKSAASNIALVSQSVAGVISSAGTGSGQIIVYGGNALDLHTLTHEAARNIAHGLWNSTTPPPGSDYYAAMNSGEPPVNEKAATSPEEDFAEAVSLYSTNPSLLQQIAPRRFTVIDAIMNYADEDG